MFGLFKKNKISPAEYKFVNDLAIFSSDIKDYVNVVSGENRQVWDERAINNWAEKNPNEAHYSASDFFMDTFTGSIFELLEDGRMDVRDSVSIYREVVHFFDNYPKYNSDVVEFVLGKWERFINDAGCGPVIHY